jgi:hypothetical protein
VLASSGREARTGTLASRSARPPDLLMTAAGKDPAGLARKIAAAALDIATDAHRARDYETATRAARLAIDAIAATARAQHDLRL